MSVNGTKQTFILTLNMSALGGKADIPYRLPDVRYDPKRTTMLKLSGMRRRLSVRRAGTPVLERQMKRSLAWSWLIGAGLYASQDLAPCGRVKVVGRNDQNSNSHSTTNHSPFPFARTESPAPEAHSFDRQRHATS